jgi:predicted DNA-binding transcriptional regulator AlpA
LRPSSPARHHLKAIDAGQLLLPFRAEAEGSPNSPSNGRADGVQASLPRRSSGKTPKQQNPDTQERRKPKRKEKNAKQAPLAPAVIPPEDKRLLTNRTEALGQVRFLRLPEVKAITGLGKTSIYELIRDKSFPAPIRLRSRAVAWVESEVRQWAQERVHGSRPAA